MKNNKKLKYSVLTTGLIVLSFSYIIFAADLEPGSEDDPIVTKSYVELRNDQLKYYVDESINKLKESLSKEDVNNNNNETNIGFTVVNISKGQNLIAGASTEIILRGGHATVIDSPSGGIADVTKGYDLKKGQDLPPNHLVIVPRDDGRGAYAVSDCIFMVKGSYNIQ